MIAGAARFLEPLPVSGLPGARRRRPARLRAARSGLEPRLLEVELALDPAAHLVADLARCCAARSAPRAGRRTARTSAGGRRRCAPRTPVAVAVGLRRRSAAAGSGTSRARARPCRRAPSPRPPPRRGARARPRRAGSRRGHLLPALLAVVADPEPVDQRPERQALSHERHQDHREGQEDDQVAFRERRRRRRSRAAAPAPRPARRTRACPPSRSRAARRADARRARTDSRRSIARIRYGTVNCQTQPHHDHHARSPARPRDQLAGGLAGEVVEHARELEPDEQEQDRVEDEGEDLPDATRPGCASIGVVELRACASPCRSPTVTAAITPERPSSSAGGRPRSRSASRS